MIRRRLVRQFGRPHGALGWVAGRIMFKRAINIERTRATVALLELGPDDRVLELGHGPGIGLSAALGGAGHVVGLEWSATMSKMAARNNRAAVRSGRLELVVGDAQSPPPDIGRFDAIFSSNVWLFWEDPVATFAAWRPHLGPGGVMAVTFRPPHAGADADTAVAAGERIGEQLVAAGYESIRLEVLDVDEVPAVCVLGSVPVVS